MNGESFDRCPGVSEAQGVVCGNREDELPAIGQCNIVRKKQISGLFLAMNRSTFRRDVRPWDSLNPSCR